MPFQEDWFTALKEYGVDEFKSKEFWTVEKDGGLAGKYKGWSFDKANCFISDLVRIIRGHNCYLMAAVVNLPDFFSYDEESRKYLTGAEFHVLRKRFISSGKPNSAYATAFTAIVGKAVERAAQDRELCHFIFDEQSEYESFARARIADLRKHYAEMGFSNFLGDLGYSPSHRVGALQAADLVAHVCKTYYRLKFTGQPVEIQQRGLLVPLEIFSHLLADDNHAFYKLEKEDMDAILSGDPAPTNTVEQKV